MYPFNERNTLTSNELGLLSPLVSMVFFFFLVLILHFLCAKSTFYSLQKFFPLIPLPHLLLCHHNYSPSFQFHPSAAWSSLDHLLSRTTATIPCNTKLRFGVHPIATSFSYLLAWLLWSLVLGRYLIFVDNLRFSNVIKIKKTWSTFFCLLFGVIGHIWGVVVFELSILGWSFRFSFDFLVAFSFWLVEYILLCFILVIYIFLDL